MLTMCILTIIYMNIELIWNQLNFYSDDLQQWFPWLWPYFWMDYMASIFYCFLHSHQSVVNNMPSRIGLKPSSHLLFSTTTKKTNQVAIHSNLSEQSFQLWVQNGIYCTQVCHATHQSLVWQWEADMASMIEEPYWWIEEPIQLRADQSEAKQRRK